MKKLIAVAAFVIATTVNAEPIEIKLKKTDKPDLTLKQRMDIAKYLKRMGYTYVRTPDGVIILKKDVKPAKEKCIPCR